MLNRDGALFRAWLGQLLVAIRPGVAILITAISCCAWLGCVPSADPPPASNAQGNQVGSASGSATTAQPSAVGNGPQGQAANASTSATTAAAQETWEAMYLQGNKVGYVHTTVRPMEDPQRGPLVEITAVQKLSVRRFGDATEPQIQLVSVETPAGQLVRFSSQMDQGPTPVTASGQVVGQQLQLETTSTGSVQKSSINWSPDWGGFFAAERSLARQPLSPGGARTMKCLAPMFNQVVTCTLQARQFEETKLLDGSRRLLHVDVEIALPGGSIRSIVWTDEQGQSLKSRIEAMGQETYRTTKEVALAPDARGSFDLGLATTVPLTAPLADPHGARRIVYRVTITPASPEDRDTDPTKIFAQGPTQRLNRLDATSAELTAQSIRPGQRDTSPPPEDVPPTEADRRPNQLIQSDNPRVVQMAREAVGQETDRAKVALALEHYVHRAIRQVNFSQTLATAADVAESRQGDCTEHAVLLAALARAQGIPARVAIGLVYVERLRGFGYHMWNELYLEDRWIPIDATMGHGGIGAGHIKLAHSNLDGVDGYSAFLPVAKVMGRLKIEVIDRQ